MRLVWHTVCSKLKVFCSSATILPLRCCSRGFIIGKNPAPPPRSAHSSNVDRVEEVTSVSLSDQLFFLSIDPKYDETFYSRFYMLNLC